MVSECPRPVNSLSSVTACGAQGAARQVLHGEAAKGMADEDGLAGDSLGRPGNVIRDFAYAIASQRGRLLACGRGGGRIARPTGSGGRIAIGAEELDPV